jgi:hypothetical protein
VPKKNLKLQTREFQRGSGERTLKTEKFNQAFFSEDI